MDKNSNRKLNRFLILNRVKNTLLIFGIIVLLIGFMCFGSGYGINPISNLSIFNAVTNTGAFVKYGLFCIIIGILLIVISIILSKKLKT